MNLIRTLPAKLPEIGRLRLGVKAEVVIKGETKIKPQTIDNFRLTSADEVVVKAFAARYGGEVGPWQDQYEVISEATEIDVILPADPIMTAYERWGKGGCQRRCNGEDCDVPVADAEGGHLEQHPCLCAAEGLMPGESKDACNVTVRLRVVDPYAPGIGHYLLTSGSVNAAMELPGQVALIESVSQRGAAVPAVLAIEHREAKKPWEKYVRRFLVPVLRVRMSMAQMAGADGSMRASLAEAGISGHVPEIERPTVAAIGSGGGKGAPLNAAAAPARSSPEMPPLPGEDDGTEPAHIADVRRALATLNAAERMGLSFWWKTQGFPSLKDGLPGPEAVHVLARIATIIAERPFDPPEGGTGSPEEHQPDGEETQQVTPGRSIDTGEESAPSNSGTGSDPGDLITEGFNVLQDHWDPPAGASAPDERPPTEAEIRDVAKLGDKVFRAAYDAAPTGDKTKARDRLRHALTFATTGLPSLNDLTMAQLIRVDGKLREIERGSLLWEASDVAALFTTEATGKTVRVDWAQVEGAA